MAVNNRCAHCRSIDVQAGLDQIQCLRCGGLTDAHGRALPPEPQASVTDELSPWRDASGRGEAWHG